MNIKVLGDEMMRMLVHKLEICYLPSMKGIKKKK